MVQDHFSKWTTAEYKEGEKKGLLGDLSGYFWLLPFLWLDYGETETWLAVVLVYLFIFFLTLSSWTASLSFSFFPSLFAFHLFSILWYSAFSASAAETSCNNRIGAQFVQGAEW